MDNETSTNRLASDLGLGREVRRRLYPAILLIALLVGLGFPTLFVFLEQRSLQHAARACALELARDLEEAVGENPSAWHAQAAQHLDVVGEALSGRGLIAIRIVDRDGRAVATYAQPGRRRTWMESLAPAATESIRKLGHVETRHDPAGMVSRALSLLLASSVLAIGLAVFIHAFPLRFLRKAEGRIRDLVEEGRRTNVELEKRAAENARVAGEHARLHRDAEARAERLATLGSVTQLPVSTMEVQQVANAVAHAATLLLGARTTRVWINDPDAEMLRLQGSFSFDPDYSAPQSAVSAVRHGAGLIGTLVQTRAAEYIEDIQCDPRFLNPELARRAGFRAAALVPLITGDHVVGVLSIFLKERRQCTDEERQLIQLLAGHAAIAIENARLYREAQRAVADLRRKNEELDSFVYSVSHDLKAPLVAVQGMAGALLEDFGPELDGQGRHYLGRLQANVEQMERLIQDLLALFRIGRESRRAERVSVADVIDDVLAEYGPVIRARGIRVSVGDVGTLHGVRSQIGQVFGNLIGNAIKYAGDGVSPTVEVGMVDRGTFVECYVKDDGIGIDPAYHGKIFEVFQRLNEAEAEGTGVGLAIVKKIVDAAGGRVWVESAKGQGATFRFTWPAPAPEDRVVPGAEKVACPHGA